MILPKTWRNSADTHCLPLTVCSEPVVLSRPQWKWKPMTSKLPGRPPLRTIGTFLVVMVAPAEREATSCLGATL